MEIVQAFVQKITQFISSFTIAPAYIQAGAVIILLFLLVMSLAQFRHHFVKWSMKGGIVGLFFGVLLTLLLEGFLLINGNTAIISILGWKEAPKPFSTALDLGKDKLINILSVTNNNSSPANATIPPIKRNA